MTTTGTDARYVPGEDLGIRTDLEVLREVLGDLAGRVLYDVGCGDGWLTRELAAAGARVTGFEPNTTQAERNTETAAVEGARFAQAGAECLPVAEASADGVLFSYSLHHVPRAELHTALGEARRVLRPDGFLYVTDPIPEGSFWHVMQPFHDETLVQRSAERALAAHARPHFESESIWRYTTETRYADFEAFVRDMMTPAYVTYTRDEIDANEVRRRFEACREGAGFALLQPMRVNLYRQPRRGG